MEVEVGVLSSRPYLKPTVSVDVKQHLNQPTFLQLLLPNARVSCRYVTARGRGGVRAGKRCRQGSGETERRPR